MKTLKSVFNFFSILVLSVLILTGAARVTYAQTKNLWYLDTTTYSPVTYPVPEYAFLQAVDFRKDFDLATITFELSEVLPVNEDRLTLEAYFDDESEHPGYGLIYCHGTYSYGSNPLIFPGEAALIDLSDYSIIQYGKVSILGNQVAITLGAAPLGEKIPTIAVTRYLPAGVILEHVSGGFSSRVSSLETISSELVEYRLVVPSHPESIGLSMLDRRVPPIFPRTCPPNGDCPKPGDLNGDGIPDWDYSFDHPLTNGLMIDVWGIDFSPTGPSSSDCWVLVVGRDTNRNGRLDADEVIAIIGQCEFPGGRNDWYIENGYVHWINWWPPSSGGNGQTRHYIYDPVRNILKVYYDPDGPGPQPAVLEYHGSPSGYSRWVGSLQGTGR